MEITYKDLGRKVLQANGKIAVIVQFDNSDDYPVCARDDIGESWHATDGSTISNIKTFDLLKFIEE